MIPHDLLKALSASPKPGFKGVTGAVGVHGNNGKNGRTGLPEGWTYGPFENGEIVLLKNNVPHRKIIIHEAP